mmetsp:Transcript_16521/g.39479  ORF Transcript_16521/g.39479 Transcript_16521/m.39479 type:complete len:395 (+) Transcript_16521:691-1875(+)
MPAEHPRHDLLPPPQLDRRAAGHQQHAARCGYRVRHHLLHLALALRHRHQRSHQERRPLLPHLAGPRPRVRRLRRPLLLPRHDGSGRHVHARHERAAATLLPPARDMWPRLGRGAAHEQYHHLGLHHPRLRLGPHLLRRQVRDPLLALLPRGRPPLHRAHLGGAAIWRPRDLGGGHDLLVRRRRQRLAGLLGRLQRLGGGAARPGREGRRPRAARAHTRPDGRRDLGELLAALAAQRGPGVHRRRLQVRLHLCAGPLLPLSDGHHGGLQPLGRSQGRTALHPARHGVRHPGHLAPLHPLDARLRRGDRPRHPLRQERDPLHCGGLVALRVHSTRGHRALFFRRGAAVAHRRAAAAAGHRQRQPHPDPPPLPGHGRAAPAPRTNGAHLRRLHRLG